MVHGAPDYHKRIIIAKAFEYTDKVPVYEVAPWTVRYQAVPPDLSEGDYAAALADIKGRPIVKAILDSASPAIDVNVTDKWTRQLGQMDLARVLGAALSKTNPIFSRLTDGTDTYDAAKTGQLPTALDTGALKVREQNPLTSISVSDFPADYPDSAVATKLAGGLPAALDTGALKIREQNWPATYDVSDRATRILGEIDNLKKWGGTSLTGRDISGDLSKLDVALSTLARLQPWYQPDFIVIENVYAANNVAPHAATTRWTYTTPASRIAQCTDAFCSIIRSAAPSAAGVTINSVRSGAASPSYILCVQEITVVVGVQNKQNVGTNIIRSPAQKITCVTRDLSTDGTYDYVATATVMQYNV
jgi:hypothetical protein